MPKKQCNLCTQFFLTTDDMIELRLEKHEEWHEKSSYFGTSKNMIKGKVKWITTQS